MNELNFFKDYLIKKYNKALYRIPIDLAMSCPNREKGFGCSFCPEDGSRAKHLRHHLDLKKQVDEGRKFLKQRYKSEPPYIAYFQAYTSTNDSIDNIKKYYSEVLSYENFAMIIIATRADCLSDEIINYIEELNKKYDVWVELGVQSSNDKTLNRINRGHNFAQVANTVLKLQQKNIKTAAHVILGLPGENIDSYLQTANDISKLPFSAIKIHNLLVLKKTQLAKEYHKEKFPTLNEYEYANALKSVIKALPNNWIIMRITADYENIIAPKWWMSKGQFINYFKELFNSNNNLDLPKVQTEDGSYTFFHPKYKQHFHTIAGAETEAVKKFVEPSKLEERLAQYKETNLLDIGFGLGYNAFAAVRCTNRNNNKLNIISLEQDIKTLHISQSLFEKDSLEYNILSDLIKDNYWSNEKVSIKLLIGDARKLTKTLDINFDIIFLDAFSPDKNPELWSYDYIKLLKSNLNEEGIITTYSSAYSIRGAFIRNGMFISESKSFGRKKGGTIATLNEEILETNLQSKEIKIICKSIAGVSYRDPKLNWDSKKILEFRKNLVSKLKKKGVPKWYIESKGKNN